MCGENEFVAFKGTSLWLVGGTKEDCGILWRETVRSRVLGFFCLFSVADLGFRGCCGGSGWTERCIRDGYNGTRVVRQETRLVDVSETTGRVSVGSRATNMTSGIRNEHTRAVDNREGTKEVELKVSGNGGTMEDLGLRKEMEG